MTERPTPLFAIDYRQLVQNLEQSHFLFVHDREGVFTYLSDSVERILGYAPEQFLAHFSRFMTDHPVNGEVTARTEASLRGEKQPPYRVQVFHADGTRRWLEVSENPVWGEGGEVLGVQGIAEDITARVEAEERLQESEAKFKHSFHSRMILATISTLPEGVLVEANEAWLGFFGFSPGETLGKRLTELPSFMNQEVYARFVEALEAGGSIPETELVVRDREGKERTVLFSAERVLIGNAACALALAKDITERKNAEIERRRHEERLQMAMEAGGMASWEWNVPDGSIRYSQSAELVARGENLEPYSRIDRIVESVHPDGRERFQGDIAATAERGVPFDSEYRVLMHDGEYHWIHGRGLVSEWENGRPRTVLGVSADITDRKFVEEERSRLLAEETRSRVQAEALARNREEFLSMAAHELKTPLAALTLQIEGMQRLLLKENADPAVFSKGLEVSARQVQRLVRLVTSLLDITRLRNGRFELNPRLIDLVPLVSAAIQRYEAMIRRADCTVTYSGDETLMGFWDPDRIDQVLENLLSNALKYGGGTAIEWTGSGTDREVRLTIRDYGIGIPESGAERIFDPYERAGAGLHYGGLGMGLYISREIVNAHGGSIGAERMGDGGTLFTVTLPR